MTELATTSLTYSLIRRIGGSIMETVKELEREMEQRVKSPAIDAATRTS